MKKSILIISLLSLLLFSFSIKNTTKSTQDLANVIFETIKNNKEKQFLKLFVKNEEIIKTIDAFDMDKNAAREFKAQFVQKLNEDRDKTIKKLKDGFIKIQSDIKTKSCKSKIQLGQISHKVAPLRNIPLEIGTLNFEYICEKDTQEVSLEVINTTEGWRVLEKIRFVN